MASYVDLLTCLEMKRDVAKHLGVIYRLELVPAVSATEAFMDVSARVIVPEISSDMQFVAV